MQFDDSLETILSASTEVSHLSRPVDLSENVTFGGKVVDLSHEKRST